MNLKYKLPKSVVLVLLSVLTPLVSFSQNSDLDKITLHDKTTYTGKLVAQKPGEYVRLVLEQTTDTLQISMDSIDEIAKVPGTISPNPTHKNSSETSLYNSNRFQTSLSYHQGGGDVSFIGFGLGMHYWISPAFAMGVTSSYLGEVGSGAARSFQWQKIPLMLESLYEYQKYADNRMALYAKIGLGYSFTLNGNYYDNFLEDEYRVTNGFAFNPGLGFRYNLFKNFGGKLEVSYLMISDQNKKATGEKLSQLNWNAVMVKLAVFF